METYALFEDGSASRIVFEFFASDPADNPVRLACIGMEDPQVVHSAQNGCLSAYHLLCQRGYIAPGERFFPSCQFGDGQANIRARGSSAGLAFCLKFAREVHRLSTGRPMGFSVAATGVIDNGSREAVVGRVEGIQAKVRGAMGVLKPGDRVFFPAANEREIDASLWQELKAKGLELVPVATVEEALYRLIPTSADPTAQQEKQFSKWTWAAAVGAVLVGALWWAWEYPKAQVRLSEEELMVQCEQGEYIQTQERLEEGLDQAQGLDEKATYVYRQLKERLKVGIVFHRLPAAQKDLRPERVSLLGQGAKVEVVAQDLYRFSFTVGDSCYLYAFQVDADGSVDLLSPGGVSQGASLFRAGRTYYLPEQTDTWFQFDGQEGEGMIYLVAARMRGRDLEKMYRRFDGAEEGEKEEWRQSLVERLKIRQQAQQAGLEGVFYRELALRQVKAASVVDIR
jgi:hypothetical protein